MSETNASGTFVPYLKQKPIIGPVVIQNVEDIKLEIKKDPAVVAPTPAKGVSVFFCTLTLLGTRFGAGIVGIPYATKVVGYLFAIMFQLGYIPIGIFSTWLLLQARSMSGRSSLTELGQYCYGTVSIYVINALIILAQFGFPIIFFIVFGDVAGGLIERVHGGSSFWSSRLFTQSLLGFSLIYLILLKDISKLRYAGLVILSLIIIFLILLFVHFLESDPHPEKEVDHFESQTNWAFFAAIPTFLTANTFQTSLFPAFATLKNKTNLNGSLADGLARIIAFFVYLVSPLLAFAIFGHDVEKNFLKSISMEAGVIPTILQFLFLIIAVMHIPIIFYVGKQAALIVFDEITRGSYSRRNLKKAKAKKEQANDIEKQVQPENQQNTENQNNHQDEENKSNEAVEEANVSEDIKDDEELPPVDTKEYLNMKPVFYYVITLACFFLVVVLSIVVGDVAVFFGIIGAIVGSFVILFGPGSFYIIIIHKKKIEVKTLKAKLAYYAAWVYLVGGIIAGVLLTTCVIVNTIVGK